MKEPWKKGPPQPPTLKQQVIRSVKRFVAQKQKEGVKYINVRDVEYTIDNVTYFVGRMSRDVGFMHLDRIVFNYLKTNYPYELDGTENVTKQFKISEPLVR